MLLLEQQAIGAQSAVAALFFGVGIIALLYVFRRSITLKRLQPQDTGGAQLRQRSARAHAEIEQIEARTWFARYQGAAKFVRGRELSAAERQLLAGLAQQRWPAEER